MVNSMKKAVVTGISGQDGAYLTQLLLNKNYQVYGTYRRSSSANFWRLKELDILNHPHLHKVEYDLTDGSGALKLLSKIQPEEVYNMAAQSFVSTSFNLPMTTSEITGLGVLNLLEAIKIINPRIRFYQASSSEMFGKVQSIPQNETTPFYPRSPYGITKLYAHWMTINYRESYGMFACSGILFNHESPLRGLEFVTRKITDSIAKIKLGKLDVLELGNLNAKRDWGYAGDYVDGIYRMLQTEHPDDYVLATGRTESVRYFLETACRIAGIHLDWQGQGENEIGIDTKTNKTMIKVNPALYRPAEVDLLIGDYTKAQNQLGWEPKTNLEQLCTQMIEADLRRNTQGYSF